MLVLSSAMMAKRDLSVTSEHVLKLAVRREGKHLHLAMQQTKTRCIHGFIPSKFFIVELL